jgi:chorismate mutase/prephenate dehydrogenase
VLSLDALRTEIAQVDRDLLTLAARRLALAREVGDVKARAGLPIVDYAQERSVLERAREAADAAGLDPQVADTILGTLIRAAVGVQDQDRWRSSSLGAGKTCVVIGASGRMGRWFLRFLADQGYQVGGLDILAPDDENAWGRETLPTADLVLCAAPPVATARLYDEWATSGAPPRGVIVDIASIKSPLVPAIRRLQAAGARVGSLHPMFGPSVALLRDADVVVCDTGDAAAGEAGAQLFASTTARIVALPLDEHDRLMADVLTLAHVTVMAFALALPAESMPLRSPTLGALRTLASALVRESADVYFEIQAHNPHSAAAIARLAEAVEAVSGAVGSRDSAAFRQLMDRGKSRTEPGS